MFDSQFSKYIYPISWPRNLAKEYYFDKFFTNLCIYVGYSLSGIGEKNSIYHFQFTGSLPIARKEAIAMRTFDWTQSDGAIRLNQT